MTPLELQVRFKQYALRCMKLQEKLPKEPTAKIISDQLLRSAFSAAANYRAACNAQSKKAFISKLSIAFEEIDETVFWLEMIDETKLLPSQKLGLIIEEGGALTKILAASRITSRKTKT
ncbi:MAG TPA: four helix bundle protein [Flavipsychrobacter sp.]|nr:four helix bundle protein [Flavipsychrobacter sp.]